MGCPSEVEIGDNLTFSANTHTASTGAATDADSVPSYYVYEDETGTAILSGSMAKLDDTNTTGFYAETIACTSGNGFESGKTYTIYIEAAVSSVTGSLSFGFKAYDQRKANTTLIEGSDATDQINSACDTAISDAALATAANLAIVDGIVDDILVDTGTTIPGTISTMQGNVTDILADTNEVQGDLTDGGRLDLIFDELTTQGDTNETKIDTIDTNVDAVLVDTGTTIPGQITTIDTVVDGIQADLDNATDGLGALKALIDIVDGVADSILEDTGTTLSATLSSIDGKIDIIDGIVDDILVDTAEIGIAGAGLTEAGGTGDQFTALPDVTLADGAHGGSSASITLSSYSDFTGEAAANPNVLQDGTITVTSQTEFTLSAGSADDDVYNSMIIVFEDSATATQKSVRTIIDYIGSTKTVTIDSAPDFTIASTDNFSILAIAPGSTPPTVGQIRAEMDANSTQLAAIVEDTGTTIPAQITALNNLSQAEVNAACDTALADYDAPTKAELDSGFAALNDPTAAEIRAEIDSNSTQLAAIVVDTNELQTNQGNWTTADVSSLATAANLAIIDTVVDAIKVKTDNLPTDPADQSSVEAAITSAHSTTDGKIDALNDFDPSNDTVAHVTLVDTTTTNTDMVTDTSTDVLAIKVVTDNLPNSGALTSIAQESTLADVLTDTGITLPAQISGLNNLSSADVNTACDTAISDAALATASALNTVNTVVDAIKTVTDLLPDSGALSSLATSVEISALNNISVADIITGIADGSYDLQEMIRIIFAFAAGKSNGGGTTTINFRDSADSKNRIIATVDSNGNRTAVTVNGA